MQNESIIFIMFDMQFFFAPYQNFSFAHFIFKASVCSWNKNRKKKSSSLPNFLHTYFLFSLYSFAPHLWFSLVKKEKKNHRTQLSMHTKILFLFILYSLIQNGQEKSTVFLLLVCIIQPPFFFLVFFIPCSTFFSLTEGCDIIDQIQWLVFKL